MRGLTSILSLFHSEFNKFKNVIILSLHFMYATLFNNGRHNVTQNSAKK